MTSGPPGSGDRPADDQPPPSDPGADTAPYAPPTAWTTTSGSPEPAAPAPPTTPPEPAASSLPPGVGWAAPAPVRQEVAPGLAFSDTLPRVAAWFIDGLLLTLIGAVIGSVLGVGAEVATTFDSPTGQVDYNELFFANELTIVGLAISALYFIGSWSGGRRATLGQRLLKIQVGNAFDGRPLTLDQAIRRWLGFGEFIWLIGFVPGLAGFSSLYFLWALVLLITTAASPTKQGLHDRLANSAVVRPVNAGNGLAISCVVIILILLAIPLLSIVALILLGSQVSSILSQVGESV
jgi:uncharacterized RDD family membrane protein YckC